MVVSFYPSALIYNNDFFVQKILKCSLSADSFVALLVPDPCAICSTCAHSYLLVFTD